MLLPAIILITAALVFYTIGVWSEHRQRVLEVVACRVFGVGLICDASGTYLMTQLANSGDASTGGTGAGLNAIMAVTGAIALLLMTFHLIWAVIVLIRNRDGEKKSFHKFSLVVWGIWLVPYVTGAIGTSLG